MVTFSWFPLGQENQCSDWKNLGILSKIYLEHNLQADIEFCILVRLTFMYYLLGFD